MYIVTRRRGRIRKKLLNDLKDRTGYSHLKEEALGRTIWRNRFEGGFEPVVRQNTECMNKVEDLYNMAHILCPYLCPDCWIWKQKLHTKYTFKISIRMPIYINKVIYKYFVELNQTYDTPLERKSNIKLRCFSRYQYVGTTGRSID
jgi:hypothetical protein